MPKITIANFNQAYDAYFTSIRNNALSQYNILEVGGGAHPSFMDREDFNYHIVDSDSNELAKAPEDIVKFERKVEDLSDKIKFDLVISKMVLEHVPNPEEFHEKVMQLLKPKGKAIHFFACRFSIPGLVNRILPERVGEIILRILKNRETGDHPKYQAYYKRTLGGVNSQIKFFENMGYEIEEYRSFVGHKYFKAFPILKQLEQLYTWLLVKMKMKSLATVALVVLKKK